MRLLKFDDDGKLRLTKDLHDNIPPYAILSHTWGNDNDEVSFEDLQQGKGRNKPGYVKIRFCGEQAEKSKLKYFWVDTCCIDKANHTEYSEAINSMFRWYCEAVECYVYLSDVSINNFDNGTKGPLGLLKRRRVVPFWRSIGARRNASVEQAWETAFQKSRYFRRGWTLQEILAPTSVEFFSREGQPLGSKRLLEQQIHEITDIPIAALRNAPLSQFSVDERMGWAAKRNTKKKEDKAYCLLGIFGVFMPLIYGEGENAFVRLREEIDKAQKGISSKKVNVHWAVPRLSTTLFTGREDILDELKRTVCTAVQDGSRTNQCCMVISGLGGQGKSEISLQLAQRVRSLLWGVFWVDVSTPSVAENGFLEIARRLEISASTWEEGRQALANMPHPWMLVLDNADDPDVDYQAYFPPGSSGIVLLTSRNAECKQYATTDLVALEGLPTDEATELLLKAAGITSDQRPQLEGDARGVAVLLQSHPLALIQAGAYVRRGHCTLAEYPQVYERQRKRLLGFRPSQAQSRYRDVYATFEASTGVLQTSQTQSSRDALELLPLLAVCGPNHLPLGLFETAWEEAQYILDDQSAEENNLQLTTWHVSRLPSLVQAYEDAWDSFRLLEAVNALKAFALVSTNVDNEDILVSMHPLVHAWARDRQDERQQHASWIAMACVFAVSRSDSAMWRVHERKLQPHLQAITSWEMRCAFQSEPKMAVAGIWIQCGWLLENLRDDKALFLLLTRLCSYLGVDEANIDPAWIRLFILMGRNLIDYDRVKDAVRLLEKVVRICEQTLAEDDDSRLASQRLLGMAYDKNGRAKDAVKLLEHVVRIRKQTVAEDDVDRLISQNDLAGAYLAAGQTTDAVDLLEEVVRIKRKLPEDHPERLISQHELARAYLASGQATDAVNLLEEVVWMRRTLREDHPHRLQSQHELGAAYLANKQIAAAVELLDEVVRIQQHLAEDHHDRLTSQHELARAYQMNGQLADAIELLEEVVRIKARTLPEEHPDQLTSRYALAHAYHDNGKITEAVELIEEVVRIETQTLAEDHPNRLGSQHMLAVFLWNAGQHFRALELMRNVVEVKKRVLAPDHRLRKVSEEELKYFEDTLSKRGHGE